MGTGGGVLAGAVLGLGATAIQANQQKIAEQKQKDALADAERKQQELLDKQKKDEADAKAKADAALQQGFAKAASARRSTTGGQLPGAVAAVPGSTIGGSANSAKKLIGS